MKEEVGAPFSPKQPARSSAECFGLKGTPISTFFRIMLMKKERRMNRKRKGNGIQLKESIPSY